MRNTEAGEMDKAINFMITPVANRRAAVLGCHERWIMEKNNK